MRFNQSFFCIAPEPLERVNVDFTLGKSQEMINDEEYERFVWIRDNIDESHKMAVLDPWKATALVAM